MGRSQMTFESDSGERFYGLWHNTSDTMCYGLTRDIGEPWERLFSAASCGCGGPTVRLKHVATYEPVKDGLHVRACLAHMVLTDTGFRSCTCVAEGKRDCGDPGCYGYFDVP